MTFIPSCGRTREPRKRSPIYMEMLALALILFLAGLILVAVGRQYISNVQSEATRTVSLSTERNVSVRLGIENIDRHLDVFKGKRVGLITNATGVDSRLHSSVDLLRAKVNLTVLFAPEHGLRGNVVAGASIPHERDSKSGLPIYSLHGNTRKPTAEMLKGLDVLAFDIQDIGARPYTYIYTMAYAMQSAKENDKTFVVFDRPNPIGDKVEGGILDKRYSSFIGLYPIPLRHGLTVGELARFFNKEFGIGARLIVIPMTGWKRGMQFEDTGLPWVMTSPNIPTVQSARVYPGTALFGGSNVSEGIGTTRPFELVGAPWIDGEKLASKMNGLKLAGAYFRSVHFTPQWGKYQGRVCNGVQIHVTDPSRFEPVLVGIHLLYAIREMGGSQFRWNPPSGREEYMIDLYEGKTELREGKAGLKEIWNRWMREADDFQRRVEPYRLYK